MRILYDVKMMPRNVDGEIEVLGERLPIASAINYVLRKAITEPNKTSKYLDPNLIRLEDIIFYTDAKTDAVIAHVDWGGGLKDLWLEFRIEPVEFIN